MASALLKRHFDYSHMAWPNAMSALVVHDFAVTLSLSPHFLLKRDLSAIKTGALMIYRLAFSGLTL